MPLLQVDKAGSEGSEPEMSVDSDSSDEEDDDVEDSPQAREQALEEARALLRDKRAQQGSHGPHYFEDEARPSLPWPASAPHLPCTPQDCTPLAEHQRPVPHSDQ